MGKRETIMLIAKDIFLAALADGKISTGERSNHSPGAVKAVTDRYAEVVAEIAKAWDSLGDAAKG